MNLSHVCTCTFCITCLIKTCRHETCRNSTAEGQLPVRMPKPSQMMPLFLRAFSATSIVAEYHNIYLGSLGSVFTENQILLL